MASLPARALARADSLPAEPIRSYRRQVTEEETGAYGETP